MYLFVQNVDARFPYLPEKLMSMNILRDLKYLLKCLLEFLSDHIAFFDAQAVEVVRAELLTGAELHHDEANKTARHPRPRFLRLALRYKQVRCVDQVFALLVGYLVQRSNFSFDPPWRTLSIIASCPVSDH